MNEQHIKTLADWLQATAHQKTIQPSRFWLKPFNYKKQLTTGLSSDEVLNLLDAVSTETRRLQRIGQVVARPLDPAHIEVIQESTNLQIRLPSVDQAEALPNQAQMAIAGLFRFLVGDNEILQKAEQGVYNSVGEFLGAFGWSLYHGKQIAQARPTIGWRLPKLVKTTHLVIPIENEIIAKPVSKIGGLAVLIVGVMLLTVFIGYSVVSTPLGEQAILPTPTPLGDVSSVLIDTLSSSFLQVTRTLDGTQLTHYNAAQALAQNAVYTPTDKLQVGAVSSLSGQRKMQVATAQWSGDNQLNFSLQDGGWESWNIAERTKISRREISNPEQFLVTVWSPNGLYYAALGIDGQLRLATANRILRTIPFKTETESGYNWQYTTENAFSWSPSSEFLLMAMPNGTQQIWQFADSGIIRQVRLPSQMFSTSSSLTQSWAWSGSTANPEIAIVGSNTITIYNLRTSRTVRSIDLSGTPAAISTPGEVSVFGWSADRKKMALLTWNTGFNQRMSASPDKGGRLLFWEVSELAATSRPQNLQRLDLKDFDGFFGTLEWSSDNRLLVGYDSGTRTQLRIYNQNDTSAVWAESANFQLDYSANNFFTVWSPDAKRILINTSRGLLALYDIIKFEPYKLQEDNLATYGSGAYSPDGKQLAVYDFLGKIFVLDSQTAQSSPELLVPNPNWMLETRYNNCLVWSPNSQYLAICYKVLPDDPNKDFSSIVRIWRFEAGKPVLHGDILIPQTYSDRIGWDSVENGLYFELSKGEIGLWDLRQPPPSLEIQYQWKIWRDSPAGQNAIAGKQAPPLPKLPYKVVAHLPKEGGKGFQEYTNVREWRVNWQTVLTQVDFDVTKGGYLYGFLKSQPISQAINETENTIFLEPNPPLQSDYTSKVTFSPDGKFLAIGLNTGLLQIYSVQTGRLIQSVTAHQGAIQSLVFSPDSRFLASGGGDRAVKVWDVATWRTVYLFKGISRLMRNLSWTPDSNALAIFDNTNSLVWRIK